MSVFVCVCIGLRALTLMSLSCHKKCRRICLSNIVYAAAEEAAEELHSTKYLSINL